MGSSTGRHAVFRCSWLLTAPAAGSPCQQRHLEDAPALGADGQPVGSQQRQVSLRVQAGDVGPSRRTERAPGLGPPQPLKADVHPGVGKAEAVVRWASACQPLRAWLRRQDVAPVTVQGSPGAGPAQQSCAPAAVTLRRTCWGCRLGGRLAVCTRSQVCTMFPAAQLVQQPRGCLPHHLPPAQQLTCRLAS